MKTAIRTVGAWFGQTPDRVVRVAVVVGFVMRVAWVVFAHRAAGVGDPLAYVYLGRGLANGDGYTSHLGAFPYAPQGDFPPTAFYAIGYPLFLAILFTIARPFGLTDGPMDEAFAEAAWVYGMVHAIIGALTIYLVARIARRLAGARIGALAAVIVAAWPNLVMFTATAHVETLYLFLLVAAVLVLLPALEPPRKSVAGLGWGRLIAAGVLLGLAAQVRPLVATIVPAILIAFRARPSSWRRAFGHTGIVAATMLVVLAPWTVRNAVVMPGFVLVTTGTGDALCMSRHPDASGGFEATPPGCVNARPVTNWDEAEIIRNRENTRRAVRFVIEHPIDEARLWFWRAFRAFEGDHEARVALESTDFATGELVDPLWSNRTRDVVDWLADVYYFGVVALAAIGLRRFRRVDSRGGAALVLGAIGSAVVVPILLFGDPRYKLPMHPFVAVIAAVGVARLLELRAADAADSTLDTVPI